MRTPRRIYIYAVAAISLYAVTWSVISLLQGLFFASFGSSSAALAFQIAVIVIGLPIFLGHWLWAQRLAARDRDEQESAARQAYLYGMQAAFLAPFIHSALQIVRRVLALIADESVFRSGGSLTSGEFILNHLLSMVILAFLWFYLEQVRKSDHTEAMERGGPATVRRLYVFAFSAVGLFMTVTAAQSLLFWLLLQFGSELSSSIRPAGEVARLIVGLSVWIIFWRWAQQLFAGPVEEERQSVLRKFYLFAFVFISVLSAVTSATFILAGLFKRLLGVSGVSEGDVRLPISIIVVSAVVWVYHSYVIRSDIQTSGEHARAAGVRRAYLYLVAGIGLVAVLAGLSGEASVLIRSLEQGTIGSGMNEQLAWFTAVLIAGLPVWGIPWREAQSRAAVTGSEGDQDRTSVVRRIYLYFFLFVSAMTVLASAVYVVFQILETILGAPPPSLSEMGQPIAFSLIAAALWAYHWVVLRSDGQHRRESKTALLEDFKALVVDSGENELAVRLVERLSRDFPNLSFDSLVVSEAMSDEQALATSTAQLREAKLIIAPWTIALGAETAVSQGMQASTAQKLLLPIRSQGWEWAGVNAWSPSELVVQASRAVKQILEGEEVKPGKQLGGCAIVGIIIAVLVVLLIVLSALGPVLGYLGGF